MGFPEHTKCFLLDHGISFSSNFPNPVYVSTPNCKSEGLVNSGSKENGVSQR